MKVSGHSQNRDILRHTQHATPHAHGCGVGAPLLAPGLLSRTSGLRRTRPCQDKPTADKNDMNHQPGLQSSRIPHCIPLEIFGHLRFSMIWASCDATSNTSLRSEPKLCTELGRGDTLRRGSEPQHVRPVSLVHLIGPVRSNKRASHTSHASGCALNRASSRLVPGR